MTISCRPRADRRSSETKQRRRARSEAARLRHTAAVECRGHRTIRRTRRAASGRRGARPRPHRHDHRREPASHAGRIGSPRGFRAPPSRRRAGRAHSRPQGILGPAAAALARDAGAAARHRNGGRTGAGNAARRRRRSTVALRIADLGTGSGAILLALLSELPDAHGIGTDISADALQTARANAARISGSPIARHSSPAIMPAALSGPFDLIVSNPPYIRSADIAGLAPEVRDHDPHARAGRRRRRA